MHAPDQAQPDERLLPRIAQGDEEALGRLYDRYSRPVFGLALQLVGDVATAEEVTQEVFWRVWQGAARYDPRQARCLTWLLTITRNLAIDARRRAARRPPAQPRGHPALDAADAPPEHDPVAPDDPAESVWLRERRRLVRSALSELPLAQRQALELAYFAALTQREIAAIQHAPISTVKTRIALGLKKLADLLAARGIDLEHDRQ